VSRDTKSVSSESMGEQGPEGRISDAAGSLGQPRADPLKVGWLQPDDISPAAIVLNCDAAKLVTGAEYEVTGGDSAKDI
jgi:hypothetical protein